MLLSRTIPYLKTQEAQITSYFKFASDAVVATDADAEAESNTQLSSVTHGARCAIFDCVIDYMPQNIKEVSYRRRAAVPDK